MTSKFLNISTDTTLGGSSASDNTVASQKAVKAYADTKQAEITSSNKLSASLVSGLATVATSGSYNDLSNKPTIPTVNNATLTIQKNGSNVATFTANASSNVTANISVPNVTSIYTPTGTDAVNGVAVSNAIATKQDNLVSGTNIKTINGNSLLGSGNITIETSSTPNVDGETISYNSSDALQAIAVKNVRDGSTLPIWHGTEYQWNHGDPTTWYYWQTSVTALWTSGGALSTSGSGGGSVSYGNNRFFASDRSGNISYSEDNGSSWQYVRNLGNGQQVSIYQGNNKLISASTSGEIYYSSDNGDNWTYTASISTGQIAYGNNRFVAIPSQGKNSNFSKYSTDDGVTWETGGNLPFNGGGGIAFGNNRFVMVKFGGNSSAYSTDGGVTWETGGNLPAVANWMNVAFGNGIFVAVAQGSSSFAYSTDGGETWNRSEVVSYGTYNQICFGNGIFLTYKNNSNTSYTSSNGNNWTSYTMTESGVNWQKAGYGNGVFIVGNATNKNTAIFSVTYDKCYTDTANPTTTSTVYSAPDTASSYTISSVTSGAITLSNNNTYYYNQSGNQYTYDTIGNSHPEYLCFIDGVGVKIGNTTIATNNSNNS